MEEQKDSVILSAFRLAALSSSSQHRRRIWGLPSNFFHADEATATLTATLLHAPCFLRLQHVASTCLNRSPEETNRAALQRTDTFPQSQRRTSRGILSWLQSATSPLESAKPCRRALHLNQCVWC